MIWRTAVFSVEVLPNQGTICCSYAHTPILSGKPLLVYLVLLSLMFNGNLCFNSYFMFLLLMLNWWMCFNYGMGLSMLSGKSVMLVTIIVLKNHTGCYLEKSSNRLRTSIALHQILVWVWWRPGLWFKGASSMLLHNFFPLPWS